MWPWEHLAFGYALYSVGLHVTRRHAPDGVPALVLALGTQFPDLVDKPGAWWLGVLPSGRSLGHSVLFGAALVLLLALYVRRSRRLGTAAAWAFGFGFLTHLVADSLVPIYYGAYGDLTFWFYPVTPAMVYPGHEAFGPQLADLLAMLRHLEPSVPVALYLSAFVVVGLLWVVDGVPGLDVLWARLRGR